MNRVIRVSKKWSRTAQQGGDDTGRRNKTGCPRAVFPLAMSLSNATAKLLCLTVFKTHSDARS